MQIFAHYHLLNSPSPHVYYSIQITTHAQKDEPSNNTYNIDSYPISSYRLNFHVRTVARFLSGLKRLRINCDFPFYPTTPFCPTFPYSRPDPARPHHALYLRNRMSNRQAVFFDEYHFDVKVVWHGYHIASVPVMARGACQTWNTLDDPKNPLPQ